VKLALKVFGVLVVGYLIAFVAVMGVWRKRMNAGVIRVGRVLELATLAAPELEQAKQEPPSLRAACAGKLVPGSAGSLLGFSPLLPPARRPNLPKDTDRVDATLTWVTTSLQIHVQTSTYESAPPDVTWGDALDQNFDPSDWSRHLSSAALGAPESAQARYLAVSVYDSLVVPTTEGDGWVGGSGRYRTRVVSFPDGATVCEGGGQVRMTNRVAAGGQGRNKLDAQLEAAGKLTTLVPFVWTRAVSISPIDDLCAAGGPELCEVTSTELAAR